MAKRSRAKQTANQRAYTKQVKRIKQFIARAEKRGYRFEADIIPQTPKRITKTAIENLKHLTPVRLYEKATTIDYDTGEIISGTEGRRNERRESAKKAQETRKRKAERSTSYSDNNNTDYPNGGDIIADNILLDFISRLQEPEPPIFPYNRSLERKMEELIRTRKQSKTTLLSLTYSRINEIGARALGWVLEESYDEVQITLEALLYRTSNSEDVISACSQLASIIKGSPLSMSELQDIADQEEYNEAWGGELFNE